MGWLLAFSSVAFVTSSFGWFAFLCIPVYLPINSLCLNVFQVFAIFL